MRDNSLAVWREVEKLLGEGTRSFIRALQADTMWKLVVLEDVVLKSAFSELLPAGASDGPPPLDWWPTQTSRQGDGGPLGPHVVERGGIQINRRGSALADEAVHGKHFTG